jgi:hydroxyethylthiazole kinase-like uncharacterized protein yjeF
MIELLLPYEMSEADRLTIEEHGIPGITLMENAGKAVAGVVAARYPPGSRVVVVAGPGNNGGDGFVAARVLAERGYAVRMLLFGQRDKLKGDAAEAAARWTGTTEVASAASLTDTDVVIDALYGAGLNRAVEGDARILIEAMNAATAPVYAVDLPSGINGRSGKVMGVAVNAVETITFFRKKTGHVQQPGRLHCGRVNVADIGIPDSVLREILPRPSTFLNIPELWSALFPVPRIDGHKYSRGHAVVVSGRMPTTGAARLAARGALRAGAGLATIASPRDALAVHAASNLAVMVRAADGVEELQQLLSDKRMNAVVLGPGGGVGPAMRQTVLAALATDRAVVLDADALTSFEGRELDLELIFARLETGFPTVLTPHEGEFRRLFGRFDTVRYPTSDRLDWATFAASKSNTCVVLKGPDTIVAAPGRAAIANNAPPWLATAGSGDVLAGFIAGLLAQGMPPFEAACAAVWLHGECAVEVGPGLISEDLSDALPKIYRRLFASLAAQRQGAGK